MWVAFLRGINVGGHTVRKEVLREVFLGLGLTGVSTFIASGNVVFDRTSGGSHTPIDTAVDAAADAVLEERIAAALGARLGWPVPTFVRLPSEIAAMVEVAAGGAHAAADGETLQVGLWHRAPGPAAVGRIEGLSTPDDHLRVVGRELYWLSRGLVHRSKVTGPRLERAADAPITCRNVTTLRRLVDVLDHANKP